MWHFHQKALASFSRENFMVQDQTAIQNKKNVDFFQGRPHNPHPNSFRTSQKTKYKSPALLTQNKDMAL